MRASPTVVKAREEATKALEVVLLAMENGLPLGKAKAYLLDRLTKVGVTLELERSKHEG